MEKFTKFDDPSTGINPFMPNKVSNSTNTLKNVILTIISFFLAASRLPCICFVLFNYLVLHVIKYLLILPPLIDIARGLIDFLFIRSIYSITGISYSNQSYHKDHPSFDYSKY